MIAASFATNSSGVRSIAPVPSRELVVLALERPLELRHAHGHQLAQERVRGPPQLDRARHGGDARQAQRRPRGFKRRIDADLDAG